MKQYKFLTVSTIFIIFLAIFSSCKRNGIQEPNPFGPSTFSILLQLAATPNVIFAGDTRESTTVTATLKRYNGVPIANTVVHFDIRDDTGNKVNLGFFEGNESVTTRTTDQNGMVSVSYYGPFSQELTTDRTIYIAAVVAWEGNEFINELTPIYLIREAVDMTFTLIADPNVLFVTENHPQSQLKAYFKTVDGIPITGRKVYFEILSGMGTFTNNKRKTFVLTDANGYAVVSYVGPTKNEIGNNQIVTIQGSPETATPFNISEEVEIRLIREEATSTPQLQLVAAPNVIIAGDMRESTTVTATLIRDYDVPVANTDIHFSIQYLAGNRANLGFFEGNESVITRTTDQNGMISVTYFGPISHELSEDTTVYIKAQVAWEGNEFINEQTPIYLIRDAVDLTFTLIADPNVLLVTESRPQSQLKAYFKTVDGVPLAGRIIYFEILSGAGSFADDERRTFVLTDANGYAVVSYFGPTIDDIENDQTVQIQAKPETASPYYIHEEVDIRLIREESISTPTLQLSAVPNVIIAGGDNTDRETATVTAILKWDNGVSVPNTDIHFSIRDVAGNQTDLGFFTGNKSVITGTTDQNGRVSVIYFGPLAHEFMADTTIYIKAQVAWADDEFINEQTPILIIRDAVDLTFTLSADPNVLFVTESRPHSQLKVYIKAADGIPFAERKVDILMIRKE